MSPRRLNITSIEKRRRHRGEAAEGEKKDAIPNLPMKHPNETFATYAKTIETLATYVKNTYKAHLKNI
jgi:hypothetical protein